jgi:ATP-dependent protease Clp ATPase subunit
MCPEQEIIRARISHLIGTTILSECAIRPHFFLAGPSGSGKSFLVNEIADELEVPFFEINAAQLTSEGMSGNSLTKAMRPLRQHWNQPNVIFVDEFDKLFQRNGENTQSFRADVQDEFLRVLESTHASIFTDYGKYEQVRVDNTMFIFAGAFSNQKIETIQDLKDAGIRNEFVGRVPLIFSTEKVHLDSMLAAVKNLKLLKDYLAINPTTQRKQAERDICQMLREESKASTIGVRLMNACVHRYFMRHI